MRNRRELGGSPEKIRGAALRMLERRAYAKTELLNRLKQKGAEEEASLIVVSALEKQGFIDDEKTAEAFIHYRKSINAKGRYYILRELAQKGIDKELAENSIDEYYQPQEEKENLRKYIRRSLKTLSQDKDKRRRQLNNLVRKMTTRGFPLNTVFEVLQEEELDSLDNSEYI